MTVVQMGDKPNYLNEAIQYLTERGLTVQDLPIAPDCKQLGRTAWHTFDSEGKAHSYRARGWGFPIIGFDGEAIPGFYLMRVCNLPGGDIFRDEAIDYPPKFIQVGSKLPILYYTKPRSVIAQSKALLLHEKVTSAVLSTKLLGIPSIAMSGCWGYAKDGRMHESLQLTLLAMPRDTQLIVCLDGDIQTNEQIEAAASRLLGIMRDLRSDIKVTFPVVPENSQGIGWDDFIVSTRHDPEALFQAITADGAAIDPTTPLTMLGDRLGLMLRTDTNGAKHLVHTLDNYNRLTRAEEWSNYRLDIFGDVYNGEELVGSLAQGEVAFQCWLEREVCGTVGDRVKPGFAQAAFRNAMVNRRVGILVEKLRELPDVPTEEARFAALRLVSEGINVHAPITQDEAAEVFMLMSRDMILRWSTDPNVIVQWVLALIGPSGCGKSSFWNAFLAGPRVQLGYAKAESAMIVKTSPLLEWRRMARTSMAMLLDDYKATEAGGREIENNLYQLTTERITTIRQHYENDPTPAMLYAVYAATTTDRNKDFLRSEEGSGERRFLPMEVSGTLPGRISTFDFELITECGMKLLTWAAQHGTELQGNPSDLYAGKYIGYIQPSNYRNAIAEAFTGQHWAALRQDMMSWRRPATEDYRFSLPMFSKHFRDTDVRNSAVNRHDITNMAKAAGAKFIGKARVNIENGCEVVKDNVYTIADVDQFIEKFRSNL
jgi:hypothetical protein